VHTFYIENDADIFPPHYTWRVAEKEFKMAVMMKAMINSCEIILEKLKLNLSKTIVKFRCALLLLYKLYSIKYTIY